MALVLVHIFLVLDGAWIHSPTLDETVHLDAGLRMVRYGYFDKNLGNPPMVNVLAALPIAVLYPDLELPLESGRWIVANPQSKSHVTIPRIFTLSRFFCIPLSLLGAYVCYRWSSELHGGCGGLLSLSLWCFSPNILGSAQLITADVAAATAGILAAYRLWRWWVHGSSTDAVLAGITMGIALLAKMVWAISFVLWPTTWLLVRLTERGAVRSVPVGREARQMIVLLLTALVVLNWGYAFERTMRPLGEYSQMVQAITGFKVSNAVGLLPVPLPENYIRGIGEIHQVMDRSHRSYLAGQWRETGWWYYYLYGLAVKLPLGALGLCAIGLAMSFVRPRRNWASDVVLAVPAVGFLAFVSYFSNMSHHFRYALPFLPFCFVFAGRAAWSFTECHSCVRIIACACWVAVICSSLWNWPHSLSYFNAIAGGSSGGRYHLVDSSLDWGQDLLLLKRWLEQHPEARPLNFAYFGSVDPQLLGIRYNLPASADQDFGAGWYAISVNFVMGRESLAPTGQGGRSLVRRDDYRYFRQLKPVARAGYSIDIYHLEGRGKDDSQLERGP